MHNTAQAQSYGTSTTARAGTVRPLGESPTPTSRIQESLDSLNIALNDLAVTESMMVSRLTSVSKPVSGPKEIPNQTQELTVASPLVDQIVAMRQRVLNIIGSMNDTLARLET